MPEHFLDRVRKKAEAEGIPGEKAFQQLVDEALENSTKENTMRNRKKVADKQSKKLCQFLLFDWFECFQSQPMLDFCFLP